VLCGSFGCLRNPISLFSPLPGLEALDLGTCQPRERSNRGERESKQASKQARKKARNPVRKQESKGARKKKRKKEKAIFCTYQHIFFPLGMGVTRTWHILRQSSPKHS